MFPQRLPIVNSDDGAWGNILNQYIEKEHYNTGSDDAANGGHQKITIRAGTASVGTAPLKFTSGTLLSAPEAGAIEFLSDSLYFTITTGSARKTILWADLTNVSGTLGIANGGTGQTSANDAFNALAPSQTGNSGEFLTTDGSNTSWAAVSGGVSASDYTQSLLLMGG